MSCFHEVCVSLPRSVVGPWCVQPELDMLFLDESWFVAVLQFAYANSRLGYMYLCSYCYIVSETLYTLYFCIVIRMVSLLV